MKYIILAILTSAAFASSALAQSSIARRPTANTRQVTFANGVHAKVSANSIIVMEPNGHRTVINRAASVPGGSLPVRDPNNCHSLKFWLDNHKAGTPLWNRISLRWANNCL